MNETKSILSVTKSEKTRSLKQLLNSFHTLIINLMINPTLKHLVFLFFIETYPSYSKANQRTDILARVQQTSANIGESLKMYWRKYHGTSPIGEKAVGVLVNVRWTFAIGESVNWRKSFWRTSGNPRTLGTWYRVEYLESLRFYRLVKLFAKVH